MIALRSATMFLAASLFAALTLISAPEGKLRPVKATGNTLVSYSFDDSLTDTGPDTFAVYQNSTGRVALSSSIYYDGYRSIELRDAPGDGNFPELQGYFPNRESGVLYFHFAMLIANPEQTFNIALAGPAYFQLEKDGIAFWLKNVKGSLYHVSDSIPRKLFPLKAFAWYVTDIRYDITAGRYDLTIREEGNSTPLVSLKNQPNATMTVGSAVDKFSFVGDVYDDASNVTYYVDDVVIGTDEKIALPDFVAPGRRKLFVDRWRDERKRMAGQPLCPSVLSLDDFGIPLDRVRALPNEESKDVLNEVFGGGEPAANRSGEAMALLEPLLAWRSGCVIMKENPAVAAQTFATSAERFPDASIFRISEILALVRAGDTARLDTRWRELQPLLLNDLRYGTLAAMVGLQKGDLSEAERTLRQSLEGKDGQPQQVRPDPLTASEYYFVLLWKNDLQQAADFARRMAASLGRDQGDTSEWLQRQGDALFLSGNPTLAGESYQAALASNPAAYGALTRLSDVAHVLGDTEGERRYREAVYGTLTR